MSYIELDGHLDEEDGNYFLVRLDPLLNRMLDGERPNEPDKVGRLVVNRNRHSHMDVIAAHFVFDDGSPSWAWRWEAEAVERR